MKTLKEYFRDWEAYVFGFGYGTGEQYTIPTLKRFMELLYPNDSGNNPSCYDHESLEKELTPTVAWLLINIFCKDDVIEYGTSARYGWLTEKGNLLKDFINKYTSEELYEICRHGEEYFPCYPDHCNCDNSIEGEKCKNPFFKT